MMGSRFKGDDLFGNGPHVFVVRREGRRVIPLSALSDPSVEGSSEFGDYELRVEVRGRLVSGTESGLWSQRDDIVSEGASGNSAGTLEDHHGHDYEDVSLFWFEPTGPIERGRVYSLPYVALFGVTAEGP
jgi:hypothetical protein